MKRSRKQATREALTADQVRHRQIRKRAEVDRALYIAIGGQVEWQAELLRRRAARNERCRQRTREIVAAKRAAEQLELLWEAA